MKKRKSSGARILSGLLALTFFSFGCDQGRDIAELKVEPANVILERDRETVRFSVSGGLRDRSMPLSWEVSNPAVGNIIAREGMDAEYVRFSSGINIIVVRDQYGAEGFATVNSHEALADPGAGYNLTLVANPDPVLPEGINSVSIKVINGEAPFSWSVGDEQKGTVPAGSTADTVTYQSLDQGENTVICVDRNGARGSIIITQLPLP